MELSFAHVCIKTGDLGATERFYTGVLGLEKVFSFCRDGKTSAPYPTWRSYNASIASYMTKHMAKAELLDDRAFVEWYGRHAAAFEKNGYMRDKNRVVARKLLGLFEKTPEHWEALVYLRGLASGHKGSFKDYLAQWRRRAPVKHRAFIAKIAALFGLRAE